MKNETIVRTFAKAFNSVNYELIEPLLSNHIRYENKITDTSITGKEHFLNYIKNTFDAILIKSSGIFAEFAYYKNEPQLIICYNSKYERSDLFLIKIKNNKIENILVLDFITNSADVEPTFEFYGLIESNNHYMDYTIIPSDEDCLLHCINAVNEFNKLEDIKSTYRLEFIDWRMKYIALSEFKFSPELKKNTDVKNFKRCFENSISIYYSLIEKDELDNKDERVTINLEGEKYNTKGIWSFATALSPLKDDLKYNKELWNDAVKNEKYFSFYIDGDPTLFGISLCGDEFQTDVTMFVIGLDNKVKYVFKNNEEIHLMSKVKGILIINTNKIEDEIDFYSSRNNNVIINRIV